MPFIQHHWKGTRVLRADGEGYYEWPADGAVMELDNDTAASLARLEGFWELPPTHPDVAGTGVVVEPAPAVTPAPAEVVAEPEEAPEPITPPEHPARPELPAEQLLPEKRGPGRPRKTR